MITEYIESRWFTVVQSMSIGEYTLYEDKISKWKFSQNTLFDKQNVGRYQSVSVSRKWRIQTLFPVFIATYTIHICMIYPAKHDIFFFVFERYEALEHGESQTAGAKITTQRSAYGNVRLPKGRRKDPACRQMCGCKINFERYLG